MSVNVIITLILTGLLALVLAARNPLAWRQALRAVAALRGMTPRRSTTVQSTADAAPRRLRPRLTSSMPNPLLNPGVVASGLHAGHAERPEATAVAKVGSDEDDARTDEVAPETAEAPDDPRGRSAHRGLVDAPGWPTPGELRGESELGMFDPVPPESRQVDDPSQDADSADGRADDIEAGSVRSTRTDSDDHEHSLPELTDWHLLDEGETTRDAGEPDMAAWSDGGVWASVDYDSDEPGDATGPEWNAVAWDWESRPRPLEPAVPKEADSVAQGWPAYIGAESVDTSHGAQAPAIVERAATDDTRIPTGATEGLSDRDRAIVACVRPLLHAAGGGAANPVIVVVVSEAHAGPTVREEELARAIGKLERRLAALDLARLASTTQASPRTTAAPPSAPTLTQAEERALRALVARRSAPIAARRGARIVLATARGQEVDAIARRVGVHPRTVRRWQTRFATERLAALDGASKRSSRPANSGTSTLIGHLGSCPDASCR